MRSVRFHDVSEGNKPKTQNGGELINLGGVLQPWAHLGPSGSFYMKQPACLGKLSSPGQACYFGLKLPAPLGKLGDKLLPYFCYKRAWEVEGKGSAPLVSIFNLKLVKRRRKKKKIKAETLP